MRKDSREYKLFLYFCKDNDLLYKLKERKLLNLKYYRIVNSDFFNMNITWRNTKEGFVFWYEIHLKWQIFCFENRLISKTSLLREIKMPRGHSEIYYKYINLINKKYGSDGMG